MNVLLIAPAIEPDNMANLAAFQCTTKEMSGDMIEKMLGLNLDEDADAYKPLRHALRSGHHSVLEHVNFTFYISGVSRITLDQFTRHRIASYSVSSQRYTDISKVSAIIPRSIVDSDYEGRVKDLISSSQILYKDMIENGIPKEDARFISVEGTTTSFLVTMNARELLHFFELRCCNRAQWEIRAVADKMLAMCRKVAPIIFDNAGPSCVCNGSCKEVKSCGTPRDSFEWDTLVRSTSE